MRKQKEDARAAWAGSGAKATDTLWFELREKFGATEFLGYLDHDAAARLLAIVKDGVAVERAEAGEEVTLLFNQTPFYGESGGQMGDQGRAARQGKTVARITDTQKPIDEVFAHHATLEAALATGDHLDLHVDQGRRDRLRANHSATHLLHAALRKTLGNHVTQKGSLVAADKLRFDISHPTAIKREELEAVEREVNRMIWRNHPVGTKLMTPDAAIEQGATALFGEKYGEEVRVVSMGLEEEANDAHYSVELCGGTHVNATGDIGLFKITGEAAVAAGVRRIEAVTRDGAFAYLLEQEAGMRELAGWVKAPLGDAVARIKSLLEERRKLEKELAEAKKALALSGGGGQGKASPIETIRNVTFSARVFDGLEAKELRGLAEKTLAEADIALVATRHEGKASLAIGVRADLSARLSAVTLVQEAVKRLGGKGGGGRPDMAQGGGPEAAKLDEAVAEVRRLIALLPF
jgi:alanyl-tRNA synthetase